MQDALTRFTAALQHAAKFDVLLRQYVLIRAASIFADGSEPYPSHTDEPLTGSVDKVLANWYAAHPIPEQNDLSSDAHTLLHHINPESGTAETILLSTLPRAFSDIEKTYQQWENCQTLDQYLARVQQVIDEINAYVPLSYAEHAWLTGIVTKGLQQPLSETSCERRRLLAIVAKQVHSWLQSQQFPRFVMTLGKTELRELFPRDEAYVIATSRVLLQNLQAHPEHMEPLLLDTLPSSLEQMPPSADWSNQDVTHLLERFVLVCQLLRSLNERIEHDLYTRIGSVLGIDGHGDTATTILAEIHQWTKQHVLLPGEQLSPNAQALYEALQTIEADPRSALLVRLPREIQEVREPYEQWRTAQTRQEYLVTLQEAAREIEQRGHVGEATPRVRQLWEQFKQQFSDLSTEEQRWLIKAFNEVFRS